MFGFACRRDARADAAADRPRAPHGPPARRGPQERPAAVSAARRQDPGHGRVRARLPKRVETVVVSAQHDPDVTRRAPAQRDRRGRHPADDPRPSSRDDDPVMHVNPTGRFVIGGPKGDAGLTGRKIIVDTYGGMGRHGGGAFSGKDPTKVDRSAAYAARYVAKNVVAAGLADRCEVAARLRHRHRRADQPVTSTSFGTGKIPDDEIAELVERHFDLRPARSSQRSTCAGRSTGRPRRTATSAATDLDLPWEKTDKAGTARRGRRPARARAGQRRADRRRPPPVRGGVSGLRPARLIASTTGVMARTPRPSCGARAATASRTGRSGSARA